jgi:hypothetical protein
MAEILARDGLIRTASGRITYAADGMVEQHHPHFVHPQHQTNPLRQQSRVGSISGTTTAHSPRSSLDGAAAARKDSDQIIKKAGVPVNAPFDEEYNDFSSADADLEMQRSRKSHESDGEEDEKKQDDDEEEKDPNLIEWDGEDDPENPVNFKASRKWLITVIAGLMTFTVTFASSVFSTATTVTSKQFGVSSEVMILGTSLFVLGFAFGESPVSYCSSFFFKRLTRVFFFARSHRLGSLFGALWTQDSLVYRILCFCNLPDPGRGCAECLHNLHLQILWRFRCVVSICIHPSCLDTHF